MRVHITKSAIKEKLLFPKNEANLYFYVKSKYGNYHARKNSGYIKLDENQSFGDDCLSWRL